VINLETLKRPVTKYILSAQGKGFFIIGVTEKQILVRLLNGRTIPGTAQSVSMLLLNSHAPGSSLMLNLLPLFKKLY
jgi:hypothetical protein